MFRKLSKRRTAFNLLGLVLVGPAIAAAPLDSKSASAQCAGARIELKADCFVYVGNMLACTRQSLQFTGADGKVLGARAFQPQPMEQGDDYPVIEEKVGSISCVETADRQTLVVASMFNGGNCAQCEWTDVYAPDGKLLGSTRERKDRNATVTEALRTLKDKQTGRVLNQKQLRSFYQTAAGK